LIVTDTDVPPISNNVLNRRSYRYYTGCQRNNGIGGILLIIMQMTDFQQPICFNDNGGWCWFQDPRAIVDARTNQLLISSVAHGSGTGGRDRHGNVEVTAFDLQTRQMSRFALAKLEADDHNGAALLIRPDGTYLAVYSNHGTDPLTRYRISTDPGDGTRWQPERTFDNGIGTTYANLFRLTADNAVYNFTRTHGYDPNFLVSRDDGETGATADTCSKIPPTPRAADRTRNTHPTA
jgi:hypothetical protein